MGLHSPDKCFTVAQQIFTILITVLLHTCQKPGQRLHKRIIVHDCIPLIPLQPSFRIAIMLCQDNSIGIGLFYSLSEIFPELMVKLIAVAQVSSHIQSPSIHIVWCGNPLLSDPENIIIQLPGTFII